MQWRARRARAIIVAMKKTLLVFWTLAAPWLMAGDFAVELKSVAVASADASG